MTAFGYGGNSSTPFVSGSGHEAGWLWAQEKGITSEDDVPSREGSFRDGALAYVQSLKTDATSLDRSTE